MRNKAMERKMEAGAVLNVRVMATKIETSVDGRATLYTIPRYVDDIDYCDAETEAWIWSIGKSYLTGAIIASTDARYYQNPDFDCLWLR